MRILPCLLNITMPPRSSTPSDGKTCQRRAYLADYAMAAGFTEFAGGFSFQSTPDLLQQITSGKPRQGSTLFRIDQMKSAQERLQASRSERLILRNQAAEIADNTDPEAIEVGQTEVSVKSMEQQLEN